MMEKIVVLNLIMLILSHSVSTFNSTETFLVESLKESMNEIPVDYPDSIDAGLQFFLRFLSRSKPKYQMQIL